MTLNKGTILNILSQVLILGDYIDPKFILKNYPFLTIYRVVSKIVILAWQRGEGGGSEFLKICLTSYMNTPIGAHHGTTLFRKLQQAN